jgi:uncharacterized protein YndB with AHSA1/START domain
MPEAEGSVTIARQLDTVFAFVADCENDPRWRPAVVDIVRVSGEGLGAVYQQGVKGPFGRRVAADFEVTEYEPGKRFSFRVTKGPVRPQGTYTFAPDGSSTTLTFRLQAGLRGVTKLMSPMVARSMQGEVGALDNLKRVLESGGAT